jgi:hypothetical protein
MEPVGAAAIGLAVSGASSRCLCGGIGIGSQCTTSRLQEGSLSSAATRFHDAERVARKVTSDGVTAAVYAADIGLAAIKDAKRGAAALHSSVPAVQAVPCSPSALLWAIQERWIWSADT